MEWKVENLRGLYINSNTGERPIGSSEFAPVDGCGGNRTGSGTTALPAAADDESQDDSHHPGSCKRFEVRVVQAGLEFYGSFEDDDHRRGFQHEE